MLVLLIKKEMKTEKINAKDKELIQIGKETAIRGFIDDRKNSFGCDFW